MTNQKVLTCTFGDYVEAYKGTTNTSRTRSAACIALYPTGNSIGSWVLWKIDTRIRVHRSNMQKLVTMEKIINIMNAASQEERVQDVRIRGMPLIDPVNIPEEILGENPEENPAEIQNDNPEENQVEGSNQNYYQVG
jgi:hypothetical protein